MPSFYDITFDIQVNRLLPFKYRLVKWKAWFSAWLNPLQWNKDNVFDKYKDGSGLGDNIADFYDSLTVYNVNDIKLFRNKVYVCIQTTTAGIDPLNESYWTKILDNWIGSDERISYNSQTLLFEWLLNRYFRLTFRQKPSLSDIYIDNVVNRPSFFHIGSTNAESSLISIEGLLVGDYMADGTEEHITYSFKVYYPEADIPTSSDLFKELVGMVEKYKLYSTVPIYISY